MHLLLRRLSILLALVAGAAACGGERDTAADQPSVPVMKFDSARIELVTSTDTLPLLVEIAASDEQRTMGLMERRSLGDEAGMLFWHPTVQPATAAFYMFRTRIPLDIAFIDSSGVIRAMTSMVPCPSPRPQVCPNYPAGVPFIGAVEVNGGYFARHGVKVGDRFILGDLLARLTATSRGSP